MTKIDGIVPVRRVDATLCTSWWSSTSLGSMGMFGGIVSELNMTGVIASAVAGRSCSGRSGLGR